MYVRMYICVTAYLHPPPSPSRSLFLFLSPSPSQERVTVAAVRQQRLRQQLPHCGHPDPP
jgi:hypothetical protein